MAFSRVQKVGDGSTTIFTVNFALDFINEADVTCHVDGELDGSGAPVYRELTFLSTNLIQVAGPPAQTIAIFDRTVDKTSLIVDFDNGDVLDETNLNIAQKQTMMAVHEVLDGRFGVLEVDLDAGGQRIINVATPLNGTDAANKEYADSTKVASAASAAAAEVSKDGAETAKAAADADAAATAADRVQTGLDRVATGEDVTTATTQAGTATTKATEAAASAAAAVLTLSRSFQITTAQARALIAQFDTAPPRELALAIDHFYMVAGAEVATLDQLYCAKFNTMAASKINMANPTGVRLVADTVDQAWTGPGGFFRGDNSTQSFSTQMNNDSLAHYKVLDAFVFAHSIENGNSSVASSALVGVGGSNTTIPIMLRPQISDIYQFRINGATVNAPASNGLGWFWAARGTDTGLDAATQSCAGHGPGAGAIYTNAQTLALTASPVLIGRYSNARSGRAWTFAGCGAYRNQASRDKLFAALDELAAAIQLIYPDAFSGAFTSIDATTDEDFQIKRAGRVQYQVEKAVDVLNMPGMQDGDVVTVQELGSAYKYDKNSTATVDDFKTIAAPAIGRLTRLHTDHGISPLHSKFDADPFGVSDSSDALQRWLNYVIQNNERGTLKGEFLLNTALQYVLDATHNFSIEGVTNYGTKLNVGASNTTGGLILTDDGTHGADSTAVLRNLWIDPTGAGCGTGLKVAFTTGGAIPSGNISALLENLKIGPDNKLVHYFDLGLDIRRTGRSILRNLSINGALDISWKDPVAINGFTAGDPGSITVTAHTFGEGSSCKIVSNGTLHFFDADNNPVGGDGEYEVHVVNTNTIQLASNMDQLKQGHYIKLGTTSTNDGATISEEDYSDDAPMHKMGTGVNMDLTGYTNLWNVVVDGAKIGFSNIGEGQEGMRAKHMAMSHVIQGFIWRRGGTVGIERIEDTHCHYRRCGFEIGGYTEADYVAYGNDGSSLRTDGGVYGGIGRSNSFNWDFSQVPGRQYDTDFPPTDIWIRGAGAMFVSGVTHGGGSSDLRRRLYYFDGTDGGLTDIVFDKSYIGTTCAKIAEVTPGTNTAPIVMSMMRIDPGSSTLIDDDAFTDPTGLLSIDTIADRLTEVHSGLISWTWAPKVNKRTVILTGTLPSNLKTVTLDTRLISQEQKVKFINRSSANFSWGILDSDGTTVLYTLAQNTFVELTYDIANSLGWYVSGSGSA